jgi:aromatic ring-opening dioxygenase catalytic subunit (LigB family)
LIYDYYGFPPHTYQLKYPAPGQPALADRVTQLLGQAGVPAQGNPGRGFDHGTDPVLEHSASGVLDL